MKNMITLFCTMLVSWTFVQGQCHNGFMVSQKYGAKPAEALKSSGGGEALPQRLKSAVAESLLTGKSVYNWSNDQWLLNAEIVVDDMGQILSSTGELERYLFEYSLDGLTVTETVQRRPTTGDAWTSHHQTVRQYNAEGIVLLYEYRVNDGFGNLVLQEGNKTVETTVVAGFVKTFEHVNLKYNAIAAEYQIDSGEKRETESDAEGRFIRRSDYKWVTGAYVLKYNEVYTYDVAGRLMGLTFFYENDAAVFVNERIDYVYNASEVPDKAYYYRSEGAAPLVIAGRYTNVVYTNMAQSIIDMDMEPQSYVLQSVLDTGGNIEDDANYFNYERKELLANGFAKYVWFNDAWLKTGEETSDTDEMGVTTTVDWWLTVDNVLGTFLNGEKNITTSSATGSTTTSYSYDADLEDWVATAMTIWSSTGGDGNYEETVYGWLDANEDGVFAWVVTIYEKEITTSSNHFFQTIDYLPDGAVDSSISSEEGFDAYGNKVLKIDTQSWRVFNGVDYDTETTYNESVFENTYEGGLILASVETGRNDEVSAYANRSKTVYHYAIPTQVNIGLLEGVTAYPTVFDGSLTIKLGQSAFVSFVNERGQAVKSLCLDAGENQVPTRDLAHGMYWVRVVTVSGKGAVTLPVVKR